MELNFFQLISRLVSDFWISSRLSCYYRTEYESMIIALVYLLVNNLHWNILLLSHFRSTDSLSVLSQPFISTSKEQLLYNYKYGKYVIDLIFSYKHIAITYFVTIFLWQFGNNNNNYCSKSLALDLLILQPYRLSLAIIAFRSVKKNNLRPLYCIVLR